MMKRQKTGGRKPGVPNRRTAEITAKLAELRCDPIEGMARIAMADVPCPTCAGHKKAKFSKDSADKWQHDPLNGTLMKCLACYGTGKGRVSLELQGRMCSELAQYLYPKRKAIEVAADGTAANSFELAELLSTYRRFELQRVERQDG